MIHYNDKSLRYIEWEIRVAYEDIGWHCENYQECGEHLLNLRQDILNDQALANQKELLPDIIAFNDALYSALQKMYDHAHELYKKISAFQPNIELDAKCFLPKKYPLLHPFQNDSRQELWDALCDTGWNPLYEYGVAHSLVLPRDLDVSFDEFIGMDCTPPNWNERLDQKLTKDLHLINAFHNLFDHTNFALTDFLYCRDFEESIKIELIQPLTTKK